MARIQIEIPEAFCFSTELAVRTSDLNYGAHLGHDSVVTLMQEARVLFYRSLGFRDEISFAENVGQIISDLAVQYKAEAFGGDVLAVRIAVAAISRYGFELYYSLIRAADGVEVARGKTGIVCFDYQARRIAPIPAELKNRLPKSTASI